MAACTDVAAERRKFERHSNVSLVAIKSAYEIGVSYGSVLTKLSRIRSTSLKTRIRLRPANFLSSSLVQPRRANASKSSGYFETSSSPTGVLQAYIDQFYY